MSILMRTLMFFVGVTVLAVYAAVAVGWLVLVQWLFADPPTLTTLLGAFLIVVLGMGYVGYRFGTVRVVSSLDATRLSRDRVPELFYRIERLCAQSRVRQPELLVADLGVPNALSLGSPRQGVVVFDRRLFELLSIDELEGILAHELAHMERLDTFWNTLAVTAVRTLAGLVLVALLPVSIFLVGIDQGSAWIAGDPGRSRVGLAGYFQQAVLLGLGGLFFVFTLAFLAYSRRQEFAADSRATELTGNPAALARGLAKLHRVTNSRGGLLSMLYIHDDQRTNRDRLLSTHPPLQDRIDRLIDDTEISTQYDVATLQLR
ncbi:M48 family metallopeptidase [Halovenus rubra]|uniref:M48 family metallopeptidase n=2 Tax=Halovenus rubra TaxID=869890 RepID=A0ABD5X3X8_9EURY|nr:M48 family metalloprotease [Halovenus rubra]